MQLPFANVVYIAPIETFARNENVFRVQTYFKAQKN